ncbi:MAG: hypothetical protein EXR70_11475 [Deltaproteobacteria bacterium]|nr:hypothetical protein [Deltaproteobacteria bacterium]
MTKAILLAAIVSLGYSIDAAHAQSILVLKNGRQITVQSYREDGSTIKFSGLGGEIAIPKDQIQAIQKAGPSDRPGVSISEMESAARRAPTAPQKTASSPARDLAPPASSGESKGAAEQDEAKEYQKRLTEVTFKLETAKQDYISATQGGGTANNVSKDGLKSWAMDLASRIHDSQKVAGGGGAGSTPPTYPYAPNYTAKEKELSDLRSRIDSLQKERDALVQEMKSKNLPVN